MCSSSLFEKAVHVFNMRSAGPARLRARTAELEAGSNISKLESAVEGVVNPNRTLFLRAEVRTANANLDSIVIEIGKHISDMEEARLEGDLPQNMLFSYSTILSNLISRGETLLNE